MTVAEKNDAVSHAQRLHRRGVDLNNRGRPARAVELYKKALALLGGDVENSPDLDPVTTALRGRIILSLALSKTELHGTREGLATLADAERAAELTGDDELAVLVSAQRGSILIRGGELAEALRAMNAAVSRRHHAAPDDQCNMLLTRGGLALFQGELKIARADLAAALDLAKQHGLWLECHKAQHNLGYLDFLAGELPAALHGMELANGYGVDLPRGIPLLDRARVLAESGLVREADDALAEAAAIFRRDRLAQDLGETELERARCALINGNVPAARRLAARARDRFRRRGNERWRRNAELVLLQSDLAAGRPGTRLTGPALRLRAEFDDDGLPVLARAAGLIAADAYLAAGQPAPAARLLASVGRPGRTDPITGRMHHAYVHARLEAAQDNPIGASRLVRAGLAELSAYQASFGSIDLQTAAAVHGRQLAGLGVSLALSGGRAAAVLAAAERARAASSRLPSVRPPDDPISAELLAELRQTVEALRPVMQDRDAANPLMRRRRELERQINARRWTLAGAGDVRPTAGVEQVRSRLAEHDAELAVYVEASGSLHAVTLDSGRLRLHALGDAAAVIEQVRRVRADLDVLAQPRLPGGLHAAVRGSFDRSLDFLDNALVRPLRVEGRRLVIVSTGVLGQLPWGALPSLRGVPVVVAPSATAWLAASGPEPVHRNAAIVAIAGPDLERAEDELTGIRRAWPSAQALLGGSADRAAVAASLAKGTVVHIAAHGVHQTENPLFSSLRVADGPMFAHELDQTARTPQHVILSACELGLATVRPGDEALGLTSVLLHLGTRSVVAGVARVGDDLAAETMIAYHERLAAGDDSATALAEATSKADVPVPFVCFGSSWRARG